ncbi:unnamed protein product [Paramecium octaurelia]|uniref:Uncharacterized protein n=1 Tax=Paramecium octaurelia TaxID=43137 RepID=A0A8S1YNR4_PAROT|nr:unnamed protein product [Paramecium octaurelia]
MENNGTLILQKTQKKLVKEERKILKEIIGMAIKVLDVGLWNHFKVLSCKLCSKKNLKPLEFFQHMMDHLSFFQIFDANQGRCIESNCKAKKNHKACEFNLRMHILENHSKCYGVERPLRYMAINNLEEYGTTWKQYQYFKKDISKTLKVISPQFAEQFEREYQMNQQKGAQKEIYFKMRIKEAIMLMDGEWREKELGTLDSVSIFLSTTWRKLFGDEQVILDQGVPEMLTKLFSGRKIPYYDLQLGLLDAIIKGTQLDSLRVKLLLGYFNCSQTFGELELLNKDFGEALHGIAIFDCIMNEKMIGRECIFNDILCSNIFETLEEGLMHYCKSHIGIMACISNKGCELKKDDRIDTWIEHCHDYHRDDFVTLAQKYMKQQKVYFQFKAVCDRCSVKLQSLTDVYWVDHTFKTEIEWKMEIRIRWKDLIRSYKEERILDGECSLRYEEGYMEYKKNVLDGIGTRRTINNNGKIAVCKNCKNKKRKQQMTHLKKEQFQMRDTNRLFPLIRIEGKITRKASDTFFRVIGNLNALKEKPHIFFAGTDIMYQWNSTQAKKQFKCRVMEKSQAERTDYVSACQNHTFLVNHTYQLADLSQQLLRQEKQILEVNKNLWMRYLDKEQVSNAKDKLQLEFAKMQDMLLFDGLLHRTSVKFVCGRMKQPFRSWMRELGEFLEGETVAEHQHKERCLELWISL